jgi:DNA modification methylase
MNIFHKTSLGSCYLGNSIDLLQNQLGKDLQGKVNLILTSPPFPLNNKKSYGNFSGEDYKNWFSCLAPIFSSLLAENGSIVIEMGNAWEPGRPVQSLLHLESLIAFVNHPNSQLRLIQQFICYNPARLPSPAQWVTINRIRVTDSYTHVWWIAKIDNPKADNRNVLRPYSRSMRQLLKRKKYNPGKRPSEHQISQSSFLTDNKGSIAHNFFEIEALDENRQVHLPNVFSFSNTQSNDYFSRACRDRKIIPHPARMPAGLAAFFIEFLSDPCDLVLDPFAGSNTTGFVAECLDRRWISIEVKEEYATQSIIRFEDPIINEFHAKKES